MLFAIEEKTSHEWLQGLKILNNYLLTIQEDVIKRLFHKDNLSKNTNGSRIKNVTIAMKARNKY